MGPGYKCRAAAALAAIGLSFAAVACGSGDPAPAASPPIPPRTLDPASFVRRVDNAWFPLRPGTVFRFRGTEDGKPAVDVATVTRATKDIQGVAATAIRDRLFVEGQLAEATTDWYAQDRKGNVWYLGEDTRTLDAHGRVKSREGSWQAGLDGARAGIFMPAHPRVGQAFWQEFYKGHAEDQFKVVSLAAAVTTPYVSSTRGMRTQESTPLEPGTVEYKFYVRGAGLAVDDKLKLVSVTRH